MHRDLSNSVLKTLFSMNVAQLDRLSLISQKKDHLLITVYLLLAPCKGSQMKRIFLIYLDTDTSRINLIKNEISR
jgi:hypothetical protein